MFGLGFTEILAIAVIAIVFIGPDQLPDVARTIGRFLNDLKRSTDSLKDDFKSQIQLDLEERRREIAQDLHHKPQKHSDTHESPTLSDRQHELDHHEHQEQNVVATPDQETKHDSKDPKTGQS